MRWMIRLRCFGRSAALERRDQDRADALARRVSAASGETADELARRAIFRTKAHSFPCRCRSRGPRLTMARFTPHATLRIASNTKTFVAVAALKLVEQGQLDLDAPISQTLPLHLQTLLSDGGYDVDAITARMLLQHTSGLADHAQLQVYFDQVMADPQRLWSREDQVSLAMSEGEAAGAPGERFAYSDTGYVLLGAIIENVHGAPMADAIRELSGIDQLGLRATWWEAFEPEPEGAPARFPQVAFGLPLSDINPSVDLYGGGGLISNLDDLAQYHHAAASGALFEDATLNAALISPSPQSQANGQGGYGMGFFIREYAGETCYEHSGFWGTLAVYCPETDITVAAAVTDAEAGFAALWPMVEAIVIAAR
jgi:D-alanyl-D-alanine carboxypeptidase